MNHQATKDTEISQKFSWGGGLRSFLLDLQHLRQQLLRSGKGSAARKEAGGITSSYQGNQAQIAQITQIGKIIGSKKHTTQAFFALSRIIRMQIFHDSSF